MSNVIDIGSRRAVVPVTLKCWSCEVVIRDWRPEAAKGAAMELCPRCGKRLEIERDA